MSRYPLRFPVDLRDRAALARFRRDVAAPDPADRSARVICAWSGDHVVGALDLYWGGDAPLPRELVDGCGLGEAVAAKGTGRSQVLVDAPLLDPHAVPGTLDMELAHAAVRFAAQQGAPFVFSTCAPTELSAWRALGFRPCGSPRPSRRHGFRVPVALDLLDAAHLTACSSPFLALARRMRSTLADDDELAAVEAEDDARWQQVQRLARDAQAAHAAFLGALGDRGRDRLLETGQLLEPARGAAIVREGDRGRELYVVLRGVVEVQRDGLRVGVAGPGEVFGEVGFLLEVLRTADVVAASDDVAVLKLDEASLRSLGRSDPALAASLALGIARGLCFKLLAAG